MPVWGVYPNAAQYGPTKPLGSFAAWTPDGSRDAKMTWVADFAQSGRYFVWVRGYGGYTRVSAMVDEVGIFSKQDLGGGGKYVWRRLGVTSIEKGKHHVDVTLHRGMFDAILFTLKVEFNPEKDPLPLPVRDTEISSLRNYRDDSNLMSYSCRSGFVIGSVVPYEEISYDWVPKEQEIIQQMKLWGAPNQFINGTFGIRAISQPQSLKISLDKLEGPDGTEISAEKVDLRVVNVRKRKITLFGKHHREVLVPELLLRDDRTGIPPKGNQGGFGGGKCITRIPSHQSRQIWITVHIPREYASGKYSGEILFRDEESEEIRFRLPLKMEVLPIKLKPAEGHYGIFYPAQPTRRDRERYVSPERYLSELKDQTRHGLNTSTFYAGAKTIIYAKEAGITEKPCIMQWPDSSAAEWVRYAKEVGFGGLLFYGVDEPHTEEQINRCIQEAKRRHDKGFSMLTAISSREALKRLRDYVDYPVLSMYTFSGKKNPDIAHVLDKGFIPISYWPTSTTFPLYYRALTGLYNRACGYRGSMPWAYQDFVDERLYDADSLAHRVVYPDEKGNPIPTLCWEAHRSGIDDVRYLEALDRAILEGVKMQAKCRQTDLSAALTKAYDVRRDSFDRIDGRWFEYLTSIRPGELDGVRRAFADATVQLSKAITAHSVR